MDDDDRDVVCQPRRSVDEEESDDDYYSEEEKRPRRIKRRGCAERACGWCVLSTLVLAWFFGSYMVVQLQVDKSRMTILREEELREMFFQTNTNDTIRAARQDASQVYRWLVHGSPKNVVPFDALLTPTDDEAWLNSSLYAAGHCTEDQLALLAQGKIDEDRCGAWSRPRADGCAGGFYQTPSDDDDYESSCDLAKTPDSCPAGTFCPAGFTCFVACLYGAACSVSLQLSDDDINRSHCSWPVHLKHTDGSAYGTDDGDVCPGVAYETLCPAGYFCRDPTVVPEPCPKSHYCPYGSYAPKHCPFFTQCDKKGLDAPNIHVAAAASLLGVFAVCFFILQTSRFVRHRLRRLREAVKERRALRRELRLERRAAKLANRLIGRSLSYRYDDDDDDDDEEPYFCMNEESNVSDDDDDRRDDARKPGSLELPRHRPSSSQLPRRAQKSMPREGRLRSLRRKTSGERVDLDFERLGLSVAASNGRQMKVLEGVTGSFRSGRVAAIMGPSGAGKSTLLKVLGCRVDPTTESVAQGSVVRVNGDPEVPLRRIAPLCAFVPQDDVMLRELTVGELLEFSAATRLPHADSARRRAVVRDVLVALGLQGVKHSVVGDAVKRGISGGQRKRTNLAMELVADPCVLFADEVTSGLDSATSLDVIEVMHCLASKGANVVVVLHQPALQIFESFSDVLLLAPGGRTAYLGPPKGARAHFERLDFRCPKDWSPPDFYMQLLSSSARALRVDLANEWARAAAIDSDSRRVVAEDDASAPRLRLEAAATDRAPPPWPTQLYLQFMRAMLRQRRIATSIAADLAVQTLAGGGIGLLYQDYAFKNTQLVNFMVAIALGMTLSLAAVGTFAKARDVFIRECCSAGGGGLSTSAYYVANNIADLPRFAALATVFVIAFYPLAQPRPSLGVFVLVACADAFAATGIGYVAGATFDAQTAQLAALCFALVCAVCSGVHPTIREMPLALRILHYSSHDRYFVETLFVETVTHMSEAFRMPPSFYADGSSSVLAQLLAYGYMDLDVSIYWTNHYLRWLNVATLIALGLAARALAYVILVKLNGPALGRETTFAFCRRVLAAACRHASSCLCVLCPSSGHTAVVPTPIGRGPPNNARGAGGAGCDAAGGGASYSSLRRPWRFATAPRHGRSTGEIARYQQAPLV